MPDDGTRRYAHRRLVLLASTRQARCCHNVVKDSPEASGETRVFWRQFVLGTGEMPRLSRAQQETRQRILDLAARSLMPQALSAGIADALGRAIPNDGYRLFGLDPATRLVNRTLAASDNDVRARNEWLRRVYLSPDPRSVIDFSNTAGAGISITAYHDRLDDCWGLPHSLSAHIEPDIHRLLYHESGTPAGGVIFASFGTPGRWLATLQLYRRDRGTEFRRSEVSFLQLMAPIIGQGLAAAFSREKARTSSVHSARASGIWLLERDGRLRYQSPAAEVWSNLLADNRHVERSRVPDAIWSAVASLHTGRPTPVQVQTEEGPVQLEASRGGDDDSIVVVLTPRRPPSLPEIPLDWRLTPQERQVVELLVRGMSNLEISRRLSSSERTIESHLSHVYAKLDVRGRSELIAKFFLGSFYCSVESDDRVVDPCSTDAALDWTDVPS